MEIAEKYLVPEYDLDGSTFCPFDELLDEYGSSIFDDEFEENDFEFCVRPTSKKIKLDNNDIEEQWLLRMYEAAGIIKIHETDEWTTTIEYLVPLPAICIDSRNAVDPMHVVLPKTKIVTLDEMFEKV